MDKAPKQTGIDTVPAELQQELEGVAAEFPVGRTVRILRNVYDANRQPTGEQVPEDGGTVAGIELLYNKTRTARAVFIRVNSVDGVSAKRYRPAALRELNPPVEARDESDITIEQPYDEEPSRTDRALGGAAVAVTEISPEPVTKGLPAAPKLEEAGPATPMSTATLPPPPENAGGSSIESPATPDQVSPEEISGFLEKTQADFDDLVRDLDSNYRNGVETKTIRQIRETLDRYAVSLSQMFNLASRARDYPYSNNVVSSAGEMRYQLSRLDGRDGMHSDLLGNMKQLLQYSRDELTSVIARQA